jgi:hypothetical protein
MMLSRARNIPIQFFLVIFSLNKSIPAKVESVTIDTLLIAKIPELSKISLCNVLTKK